MVDPSVLDATAAGLLAAARAPSRHTLASYERRWRMWEAFALHHGVPVLPAEPDHVAAFVVARCRVGVSDAALAANLSAVLWFHRELADELAGTCDLAKRVLGVLRRRTDPAPRSPAPVVSVGALVAMSQASGGWGTLGFSAKVLRLLTGAPPRQLAAVRADGVRFGPADGWVELTAPAVPASGNHPALPGRRFRFERGLTALDCPVRATRALLDAADGGGRLFGSGTLWKASIRGFSPVLSPDGVPVRIGVRNRALLVVGYQGALRIEELVRARVEHLDVAAGSYRLRLPEAKTAKRGASQAVLLAAEPGPLDPVAALDEWLAVRGDHDGPLFCTLHHGRRGVDAGREGLTAGEIRDVIGDMAVRAGLPASVSGYSLRRSWATHQYLRDPRRLPVISAQLRHSGFDMTAHYIDDLGLHVLDAGEFLSTESVLAGPGGVAQRRRDLGFDQAPLPELLAEVVELARSCGRWASSTIRTNDSYWNTWQTWATDHGLDALPASAEHLVLFATDRARAGIRAQTLRAQLHKIASAHQEAGYEGTELIDLALEIAEGQARVTPRDRARAPVLSLEELLAMAATAWRHGTAGDPSGWQDLLLLSVGYAGGLRMDDLYRARIENLERLGYGYALSLGASKENPAGCRADSVLLLTRTDLLDPVTAIDIWRARAAPTRGR